MRRFWAAVTGRFWPRFWNPPKASRADLPSANPAGNLAASCGAAAAHHLFRWAGGSNPSPSCQSPTLPRPLRPRLLYASPLPPPAAVSPLIVDCTWHDRVQLSTREQTAREMSVGKTKALYNNIMTAQSRVRTPKRVPQSEHHHVDHEQLHHCLLLPRRKTSFAMSWW